MADQYGWGAPPAPARRPVPVTLAAILMLVGAAFGLTNGIASLVGADSIADDFQRRAVRGGAPMATVNDVADGLRAGLMLSGVLHILLAIVVGLLAMFVLRGVNAARIGTWVLIAVSVCCGGCGSLFTFSTFGTEDLSLSVENVSEETAQVMGRALHDAVPGWLAATNGGLGCLQVLGYLAVAVLLALPAANRYFRKPPMPWQSPEGGWPQGPPPNQPPSFGQPPAGGPPNQPPPGSWPEPPQEPRTPMG
ncbi:hypothetical protein [Luedemannella helvata]|uniref:Uncharacterized protein n=1 Tax=Luedemannella helvata TaxID=349315 RepID=A0ABP4W6N9_9ACTN